MGLSVGHELECPAVFGGLANVDDGAGVEYGINCRGKLPYVDGDGKCAPYCPVLVENPPELDDGVRYGGVRMWSGLRS